MYAASKKSTKTSLQATHKVSCMNSSLQVFHSPSKVYVCSLSVLWDTLQIAKPRFGEKTTLSSSLHQQPKYAALILSFNPKCHIAHTKQSLEVFCSLSTLLHFPRCETLTSQTSKQGGRTATPRHKHEKFLIYSASEFLTRTSLRSRESFKTWKYHSLKVLRV